MPVDAKPAGVTDRPLGWAGLVSLQQNITGLGRRAMIDKAVLPAESLYCRQVPGGCPCLLE